MQSFCYIHDFRWISGNPSPPRSHTKNQKIPHKTTEPLSSCVGTEYRDTSFFILSEGLSTFPALICLPEVVGTASSAANACNGSANVNPH